MALKQIEEQKKAIIIKNVLFSIIEYLLLIVLENTMAAKSL